MRDSVFGLMPIRMGAAIAGGQGLIGLLLAVMGLYAVVSLRGHAPHPRDRRAHGARGDRTHVMRLVVREGMRLTVIGVVLGLLVSVILGAVLSRVLYGVQPVDVGVFAGVTVLLLGVSALACYLPARRATRVDPVCDAVRMSSRLPDGPDLRITLMKRSLAPCDGAGRRPAVRDRLGARTRPIPRRPPRPPVRARRGLLRRNEREGRGRAPPAWAAPRASPSRRATRRGWREIRGSLSACPAPARSRASSRLPDTGIVAPPVGYRELEGFDLHGKVVLVLRYEPQERDELAVLRPRRRPRPLRDGRGGPGAPA